MEVEGKDFPYRLKPAFLELVDAEVAEQLKAEELKTQARDPEPPVENSSTEGSSGEIPPTEQADAVPEPDSALAKFTEKHGPSTAALARQLLELDPTSRLGRNFREVGAFAYSLLNIFSN